MGKHAENATKVAAFLNNANKDILVRVKIVYNDNNYTTLPRYTKYTFIEPMILPEGETSSIVELSIDKFTVVAEDYDTKVKTSYTSKYQMINISYITYLYHRLLTDGRFYMDSILESDTIDSSYKDDLLKRKMSSTYSFLIKDGNEKPVGFISLEYSKPSEFKKEYESCIWKHQLSTSRNIKDITQK